MASLLNNYRTESLPIAWNLIMKISHIIVRKFKLNTETNSELDDFFQRYQNCFNSCFRRLHCGSIGEPMWWRLPTARSGSVVQTGNVTLGVRIESQSMQKFKNDKRFWLPCSFRSARQKPTGYLKSQKVGSWIISWEFPKKVEKSFLGI